MNTTSLLAENQTVSVYIKKEDNTTETMNVAKMMHWYSSVVAGTVLVVIGLIGNILSIIVWKRKSLKSSTGTYLIAQAVADMGVLLFFFFTDSIAMIKPEIKKQYYYGVFYAYIGYPVFFLFVISSIWTTVGVTVDRYIQVCLFTHSKSLCSIKKALHGIGIINLLCFVINIPHFFTYHPVLNSNSTDYAYKYTDYGSGHGSQNYEFWVHCMFLVLVPWLTILILNVMIIRQVVQTGEKMSNRKSLYAKERTKKSENQLTMLLLTVTFTFMLLIALQCVTQCFFMLKPGNVNTELVDEAFAVAKLGVIINSTINFFLYCLSGRHFRKEFCSVMGCHVRLDSRNSDLFSSDQSSRSKSESRISAM